ncbi:N-acetylglucosamine kinase-like BadF-type ATPase [Brevibacillus aydinogluensis]|uniref:N-acetylglucosamine kinase n=1 Tax=Brevibacillus aydinogluensis TaxID=927786 RepID=UPI002892E055|nr:BadF/BadG/BcrA/BcrD ATPase family protein [Brevibacillus aydinogluensis]MDT3417295.1 N-acetylglucosamine kinase-like BadF-type ATPase [Brevibacillus aydinogluensis]
MRSSEQRRWFVGIDGGGSKTTAAVCGADGQIVALAMGEGSNPLSRPWPEVEETLRALLRDCFQQAGAAAHEVEGLFFGLAGADRPQVQTQIANAFRAEWGERLQIDNDAVAALYSGTWGEPGIVLIAGTGSIAYALTADGSRHRVGGWGYLVGDEGSGYDLGRQAVAAVLRAFDGRGDPTALTGMLVSHYGVEAPDQLIARLYGSPNPRRELAGAAILVDRAAAAGDEVAGRLVRQAAASLVELAEACRAKAGERLPVVLAGGLLASDTMLRRAVLQMARFEAVLPDAPPVAGCLAEALRRAGLSVNAAVRKNLCRYHPEGEANGGELV